MAIVLFEDSQIVELYPVTLARLGFAITCGGTCLIDQARRLDTQVYAVVRPYLQENLQADYTDVQLLQSWPEETTLFLNALVVPSATVLQQLRDLLHSKSQGIVRSGDRIVAALVQSGQANAEQSTDSSLTVQLESLNLPVLERSLPLLEYPHDIVRYNQSTMNENLADRIEQGTYQELADGVFVAPGAKLGEYVVTDTAAGPILLEEEASIGPYCFLQGPAIIGKKSRVIEHSAIKDFVTLGHTTKIGGEVEASIIEPFTNKQHHGFLGHSYLGSWINLGAGTCNSDLKNTYGKVNMRYGEKKIATNMQFVGVIMGDYAKTAINTGIFTGKTIGVCSMVYGFVTTNVPSFVNYARLFGQVTAMPAEVMVATQSRMFARRHVTQRPCDIQLLHEMYNLTRHERELGSVPPEPLSL